jgi:hypothetical protein
LRLAEEKMNVMTFQRALVPFAIMISLAGAGVATADPASFKVELSGAQSAPAVDSSGTGTAQLTYDPATQVVTWTITYAGLSSAATMAHFHGPAKAGQNAPPVIWLSKQGSPPANPLTGSATLTPEQAKQFSGGEWYINIHTQAHPAGEIRGQVVPPKS